MNKLYKKYFHVSQPTTEGYKLKQLGEAANWTFAIGVVAMLIAGLSSAPVGLATGIAAGTGVFGMLTGGALEIIRNVIFKCTESNIKKVLQNPKIHKHIKDRVKAADRVIKAEVKKRIKAKVKYSYTHPSGGFDDSGYIFLYDNNIRTISPSNEGYERMNITIDGIEFCVIRDDDSIPQVEFHTYAVFEDLSGSHFYTIVYAIAPPPKSLVEEAIKSK